MTTDTTDPALFHPDRGWESVDGLERPSLFQKGSDIIHADRMVTLVSYAPLVAAKAGARVRKALQVPVWVLMFSGRSIRTGKGVDDHYSPEKPCSSPAPIPSHHNPFPTHCT
jgi:hypothetical protein